MKILQIAALALLLASCQSGGIDNKATEKTLAELQENFQNPPQSARTQVWWHWMNGNITKDGIQKDLAWMKRGAPAEATFEKLASYTESSEFGIKYFSGTAAYHNTLQVGKMEGQAILDLGEVKDLAEVFINGQSAGIVWKTPFRVDITNLLKEGENQLEVRITNMWVNRLIGDQQPNCPEKITFTDAHYYDANDPLKPAGLMGPVKLIEMN